MLKVLKLKLQNGCSVSVELPDYLFNIVEVSIKRAISQNRMYPNNVKSDMCYVCAVNQTHLSSEQLEFIKREVCNKCKLKTPYILQRVTSICSFNYCDIAWYLDNVYGVPQVTNSFMLEGSLTHAIDNLLTEYLDNKNNYKRFKELYPDRDLIQQEILKIIENELLTKALETVEESVPEDLIQSTLERMFNTVLEEFAEVNAYRICHNIEHEGEYHKIVSRKWTELKTVGYYSNYDVNLLLVGHIDKLYRLNDNTFVIRDVKTTRTLLLSETEQGSFYDTQLQLGGYKYLLEQFYGVNVNVIGEIELSRYFQVLPVLCDSKGFVQVCDRLCDFIKNMKMPIGRPRGSLCTVETCSYFSICEDRFKKKRL
jgi:hypothetical protein